MSETLSYHSIRSANQAREADEQRTETRRKNLLILILQYLENEGYIESTRSLSKETNIDVSRYEVADNVDLETVLMEYESYYYIKFSRHPKIVKRLAPQSADERTGKANGSAKVTKLRRENSGSTPCLPRIGPASASSSGGAPTRQRPDNRRATASLDARTAAKQVNGVGGPGVGEAQGDSIGLQGLAIHGNQNLSDKQADEQQQHPAHKPKAGQIIDIRSMIADATRLNFDEASDPSERLMKPLGGFAGYNSEWRELAQVISREIYSHNPDVKWDDIIGLDNAKRLVKEAVVYPIKYPQLFTGILSPWKGLLLYGPPGTGKTLLAKAVATECQTTFFNISASSIVSKWRGDSEKLVRVLFELARFHAPSTIFLDELESLMSQRGSSGAVSEHEGSRRMKTELLVQMDGLAKTDDLVFLLAASNLPWELDQAMLRRLEKRILVDLPSREPRRAMFERHLPPTVVTGQHNGLELHAQLDYNTLADKTEGYSGSDIRLVAKEAAMMPVRKIFDALENHTEGEELHISLDTITTRDVQAALRRTKPSALGMKEKYTAWQREYESV